MTSPMCGPQVEKHAYFTFAFSRLKLPSDLGLMEPKPQVSPEAVFAKALL